MSDKIVSELWNLSCTTQSVFISDTTRKIMIHFSNGELGLALGYIQSLMSVDPDVYRKVNSIVDLGSKTWEGVKPEYAAA